MTQQITDAKAPMHLPSSLSVNLVNGLVVRVQR